MTDIKTSISTSNSKDKNDDIKQNIDDINSGKAKPNASQTGKESVQADVRVDFADNTGMCKIIYFVYCCLFGPYTF